MTPADVDREFIALVNAQRKPWVAHRRAWRVLLRATQTLACTLMAAGVLTHNEGLIAPTCGLWAMGFGAAWWESRP